MAEIPRFMAVRFKGTQVGMRIYTDPALSYEANVKMVTESAEQLIKDGFMLTEGFYLGDAPCVAEINGPHTQLTGGKT